MPKLVAIGLLGGLLSGLLGVGGGTVMVPLLVFWAGYAQRDAHATSLGAIIPISIVSAATLGSGAHIDVRAAVFLTLGAVLGARRGAHARPRAPPPHRRAPVSLPRGAGGGGRGGPTARAGPDDRKLQWLFGCFLLLAALLMLVQG